MQITLKNVLNQVTRSALDLLLPMRCLGCGKEGGLLCPPCIAALPRLEPPFCDICADLGVSGICRDCRERLGSSSQGIKGKEGLAGVRAPYLMQGAARQTIHQFKYRNVRVAAPLLGRLLADYLSANPIPGDVLVPVPLHPRKLRERGYNQAGLLAREVSKLTGLPVAEKLLYRTRNTPPQARTSGRQQRVENMEGVFTCPTDATGMSLIVVDDVSTTGSTLAACAAALKETGALSVWGLTFAKEARQSPTPDLEEPVP